jgi:hypothetical protein
VQLVLFLEGLILLSIMYSFGPLFPAEVQVTEKGVDVAFVCDVLTVEFSILK